MLLSEVNKQKTYQISFIQSVLGKKWTMCCVGMQQFRYLCSLFGRTTSGFWVWRTEKAEGVNGYEAKVKPFCTAKGSHS